MQDLRFSLFGFPVTIQPFFWILAVVLGTTSLGPIAEMPVWLANLAMFICAVLIAILIHELGHALTFRHLYGVHSVIVIHTFGGVTMPLHNIRRNYSFTGTLGYMFLAFSGPLAGFVAALMMLQLGSILPEPRQLPAELIANLINWIAVISIIWGIFNLLPIYPLDGGQIAREFLTYLFPYRGVRYSLLLSMSVAVLLAVFALRSQSLFMVLLCGYFAYMNYQELTRR
jgi:Zn-dependent protease